MSMQKPHVKHVGYNSGLHFYVVLLCTYKSSSGPISMFNEIHQLFNNSNSKKARTVCAVFFFYKNTVHLDTIKVHSFTN